MVSNRGHEIRRIFLVAALGLTASLLWGSLWFLVIALSLYVAYSTQQLLRMHRWLERHDATQVPPDSFGAWGDIFEGIYRLLKQEAALRSDMQAIIDRAQLSVTALREAILLIDRRGQLEYFNSAAQRLLGFRTGTDENQLLTNLIRNPRFTRYLHSKQFDTPLEIPSPHNEHLTLQFSVTPFGAGDLLIIARDVTRLHNLEQMRKDFVANVSHELKTPLTVLKGYLETLQDSVGEDNRALQRALLQMAQQSDRMELLVNDLLLLARLEGTEANNQNSIVDITSLLKRLLENARTLSGDKQHTLTLDVPEQAQLIGDAAELESAFSNLVTNAVKYTPAGKTIALCFETDAQGARFSVRDNGIGIAKEHLPRLTERFYRPDHSRFAQTGGTGLGLSIVKHVMIRHQGKLLIESEPGKGSVFTCQFGPERVPDNR